MSNDINEKNIEINGNLYKEITFDNGETVLKRYSQEYKTWITLRFSQNDDTQVIDKLKSIFSQGLLDAIC